MSVVHTEAGVGVCYGIECPTLMAQVSEQLVTKIGSMGATEYMEGMKDDPTFKRCIGKSACRIEKNLLTKQEGAK